VISQEHEAMSVSLVDGKVLAAPVKFSRKGVVRFDHIELERPDGRTERIAKQVATAEIAELIAPGAEGRFYLYKVLDVKGIHGVRLTGGAERYAYPGNNAGLFLVVLAISVAWLALRIFGFGDVPLLGVLMFGLGAVGYFFTRSNRAETRRQFDGDSLRATGPGQASPAATAE
jgi:hypothetical protein